MPEEAGDIEREGTGGAFLPTILLKGHERGHTEGKRAGGEKAQITKRQKGEQGRGGNKIAPRAQSGNNVFRRATISLSSAGIDAMTHWTATVPAETQKKARLPRPKGGKARGREVENQKSEEASRQRRKVEKKVGGDGQTPPDQLGNHILPQPPQGRPKMMLPHPPEGKGVRKRDRGGGRREDRALFSPAGEGLLRGGGGGDSSFGNSGSAVTIITMVGHAMGTIGPVVGEKSGGQVQACPLPRLKSSYTCAVYCLL